MCKCGKKSSHKYQPPSGDRQPVPLEAHPSHSFSPSVRVEFPPSVATKSRRNALVINRHNITVREIERDWLTKSDKYKWMFEPKK